MRLFKSSCVCLAIIFINCSKKTYATNGETLYKTGKNLSGEKVVDRQRSSIPIINNCQTCHGKNGNAMKRVSIKFSDLSDPEKHDIPYTEELFFRFLDEDLKSDGTKADIGIMWRMSDTDKKDLLEYLKSL